VLALGGAALAAAGPATGARRSPPPVAAAPLPAATPGPWPPQDGDLTLGGAAGDVLVGLTLRPGEPGSNEVYVYVLPVLGETAAAAVAAELWLRGRPLPLGACSPACRRALVELVGGERLEVRVAGPTGGAAVFALPGLPAPDGAALLARLQERMHALQTYRVEEWLGPLDVPREPRVHTDYAFQAPDRMRLEVDSGFQRVWVGGARYARDVGGDPAAPWRLEQKGTALRVPRFDWDPLPAIGARPVAARVVGGAPPDGGDAQADTRAVSFFMQIGPQNPTWYLLWVDGEGLVRRAQMLTQAAHFMDHRYYDFDAPLVVQPPEWAGE
jgi:hypothetical protein